MSDIRPKVGDRVRFAYRIGSTNTGIIVRANGFVVDIIVEYVSGADLEVFEIERYYNEITVLGNTV